MSETRTAGAVHHNNHPAGSKAGGKGRLGGDARTSAGKEPGQSLQGNGGTMIDWQLTIPGVELKSSNHDLRGITRQGMFGKSARAKKQREAALLVCRSKFGKAPPPPLVITITRIAPAELDTDNNVSSAKHIRDGVADWLMVNDLDKRLRWEYAQEKQGKGVYGVKIRVQTRVLTFEEMLAMDKTYQMLVKKSLRLSEARAKLEPGTSRARVTTANARWARAAEARDTRERELRAGWEGAE